MPLSCPLDPSSRNIVPLSCKECSELTACEPWPYSSWAAPNSDCTQWRHQCLASPARGTTLAVSMESLLALQYNLWFPLLHSASFPIPFFKVSSATPWKFSPYPPCFCPPLSFSGLTLLTPSPSVSQRTRCPLRHCVALSQASCPILFLFNHLFQQLLNQPYLLLCDSGQVSWNCWLPECSSKKRRKNSPIDPAPLYKEDNWRPEMKADLLKVLEWGSSEVKINLVLF